MQTTKDGFLAIKKFIKNGGAMAVSEGETDAFFIGDVEELFDLGFENARQATVHAIHVATKNWSLERLNEVNRGTHNNEREARIALVDLLTEGWTEKFGV